MSSRPDSGALIRSMLSLRTERKTGVLNVEAGGVRTFIYFLEGTPVFAEEGTVGETLGRMIVRKGMLTQEQCNTILVRMTERLIDNEQVRFGEVAVELGLLTNDQVKRSLAEQVRSKAAFMLQREEPEWRFVEGRGALDEVGRFPMRIEAIALIAARAFPPDRRAAILDEAAPRFLALDADQDTVARRFELTPEEGSWVGELTGRTSVADLAAAPAPDTVDTEALLVALLLTGVGTLTDAPVAAARPSLSVPTPAVAFRSPSHSGETPGTDDVDAAKDQAPAPPTRPRPREAPAKGAQEARLNAELAFQRGKTFLRHKRFDRALENFRKASGLDPDREEYELLARWTEAVARPNPPADAERLFLKRLALALSRRDPTMAFPPYILGRIAAWDGDDLDAAKWLGRALALEPNFADAKQELEAVKVRRPAQVGRARTKLGSFTEVRETPPQSGPKEAAAPAKPPPPAAPRTSRAWLGTLVVTAAVTIAVVSFAGWRALNPRGSVQGAPPIDSAVATATPAATGSAPTAPPTPTPTAPPTPTPTPTSTASATPPATASASPPATASSDAPAPPHTASASASTSASAAPPPSLLPDPLHGIVHLPPSAGDHRVFVDGKNVATSAGSLSVRCGAHTIRIGSSGKERPIDVPCNGELTLD